MNPEQIDLDALVDTFASEWLRLGESQLPRRSSPTRSWSSAPRAPHPSRARHSWPQSPRAPRPSRTVRTRSRRSPVPALIRSATGWCWPPSAGASPLATPPQRWSATSSCSGRVPTHCAVWPTCREPTSLTTWSDDPTFRRRRARRRLMRAVPQTVGKPSAPQRRDDCEEGCHREQGPRSDLPLHPVVEPCLLGRLLQ